MGGSLVLKHHLISKLYRRGFARPSGKVWKVTVLDCVSLLLL